MTFPPQRLSCLVLLLCWFLSAHPVVAQDPLTGAFEGYVSNNKSGLPIKDAEVEFRNSQTGITVTVRTDDRGHFYEGQLPPASYRIRIFVQGYTTIEITQDLGTKYRFRVRPNPVPLERSSTATTVIIAGDIRVEMSKTDASRGGAFTKDVTTLPL